MSKDKYGLAKPLPPDSSVVTVGTFDGVHRGHQALVQTLIDTARHSDKRSVLVTFEPHPLRIVRPHEAPLLLTTEEEKAEILAGFGIDVVAFVPFTPELAQFSPEQFVEQVLRAWFGLSHLVIGYDHGFGRGRSGDAATLRSIGARMGFEVEVVPPFTLNGETVSASKIRGKLAAGRVADAAETLGRPYSLRGTVVRGDQRGRRLGIPTANLEVRDAHKLLPEEGIYAVRVRASGHRGARASGRALSTEHASEPELAGPSLREARGQGVLHLGRRPTYEGAAPSIEVHILDFERDIYGETLVVDFIDRIRGIERFNTEPELIAAMQSDCDAARKLLSRATP